MDFSVSEFSNQQQKVTEIVGDCSTWVLRRVRLVLHGNMMGRSPTSQRGL